MMTVTDSGLASFRVKMTRFVPEGDEIVKSFSIAALISGSSGSRLDFCVTNDKRDDSAIKMAAGQYNNNK